LADRKPNLNTLKNQKLLPGPRAPIQDRVDVILKIKQEKLLNVEKDLAEKKRLKEEEESKKEAVLASEKLL